MRNKYLIHEGWQFSIADKTGIVPGRFKEKIKHKNWYTASVPGTVHTDLLNNKIIPDPFYSNNEEQLQWIGETNWKYRASFNFPKEFDPHKETLLIFEGLDTAAEIYLNSELIGRTNNMFRAYPFDISKILRKKKNTLEIIFTSAVNYGRALENDKGVLPVALRSERVYMRKAQYSFGWDWGPAFITCGIWRDVYLQQNDEILITNLSLDTVFVKGNKALVRTKVKLNKPLPVDYSIKICLSDEAQSIKIEDKVQSDEIIKEFEVFEPGLWWPNGAGEPHLYDLCAEIIKDGEVTDRISRKAGIRTVELQLADESGPTFRLVVNGKKIFMKGTNWIPADSFLPRVKDKKYMNLLKLAKEANMNIIRVWGGGTYESDTFYDICDKLGLLVWQDFMFACASYPEYDEFLENVTEEIRYNVERLKAHPSIAIWCGNNENEWIWYQEQKSSYTKMPGYKIYHDLMPSLLKELDPARPYWPSTPFGEGEDPNSTKSGNRHQWDMWSRFTDYANVKNDESLFVTEFGFQAPANYDTMAAVLPAKELDPQSRIFEFHNKQVEGPERLYKFLSGHLPVREGLKEFIYLTQLNQAFALRECVEHWQMRFPKTNGSIIWQLNDCWPVSSWAVIDSNNIPKTSYYSVKNSFSSSLILFEREENSLAVYVLNHSINNVKLKADIQLIKIPSGKCMNVVFENLDIKSESKLKVFSIALTREIKEGGGIIVASIYNNNGEILNRNFYKEREWKHMNLPKAKISIKKKKKGLLISSDNPAFFVKLSSRGIIFKDNNFIILPGEKIFTGLVNGSSRKLDKMKIDVECLNNFLS